MTLHGNALTSDESAQLAAIRDDNEFYRGKASGDLLQWASIRRLLGWHDRLASLLAAHEAERRCVLRSLGDDYAGEFEIPREKQRPLDSMVMEAMSQYENRIAEREAEIGRLRKSAITHDHDVCQILGRALGYPRFADDQKNFPGATDADGVCVADHVPETLAAEAADEIDRLRAELAAVKGGG